MKKTKTKDNISCSIQQMILGLFFVFTVNATLQAALCEIRYAQTSEENGFYVLDANVNYELHAEAQQMLEKGLAIKFVIQAELYKRRRYWIDKKISLREQVLYLQKNQLTKKYILSSLNSTKQESFSSIDKALLALNESVRVPLIEISEIDDPANIEARTRLVVDVRHFSGTVNYLAKYWNDWRLVSEWYTWPLKL